MNYDRLMTWDEMYRTIRSGDIGCILAFILETAIMLILFIILYGAWR